MKITLTFRDTDARAHEYYLRKRYHSKAGFAKLAKVAILREASLEAEKELDELNNSTGRAGRQPPRKEQVK